MTDQDQTIEIGGEEYLVPVGCEDFEIIHGTILTFRTGARKQLVWQDLAPWQKRHAAAMAHAHFTKKADATTLAATHRPVLISVEEQRALLESAAEDDIAAAAWLELVED